MAKVQHNTSAGFTKPPAWRGDFSGRQSLLPGGGRVDTSLFPRPDAVDVTANGAVAAAATSVPVDPLPGDIPDGTILEFSGGTFARLTAPASQGDVALTVAALAGGIADNETATYAGVAMPIVENGTIVGRTFADRDADPPAPFGPWDQAGDDEFFILAFDVIAEDGPGVYDATLYRDGALVKENFLPGWGSMTAAEKAAIRGKYLCTIGAD